MGVTKKSIHVVSRVKVSIMPRVGVLTGAYGRFWYLATDSLPPQDANDLAEDLGIEFDTNEHQTVEQGPLCKQTGRR